MKIKSYTVYLAVSPSCTYYVGITSNSFEVRKQQHINNASTKKLKTPFYKAIRKYGKDNIKWSILHENLSQFEARELEKKYISLYKNTDEVYNVTPGGELPWNTGKKGVQVRTKEIQQKMVESRKGYTHSEETRTKISLSNKGKKITQEQTNKFLKTLNRPKIEMYKDGEFITTIENRRKFCIENNFNNGKIHDCLNGRISSYRGYKFKYEGQEFPVFIDKRTVENNSRKISQARAKFKAKLVVTNGSEIFEFLSIKEFSETFKLTRKIATTSIIKKQYKDYTITKISLEGSI